MSTRGSRFTDTGVVVTAFASATGVVSVPTFISGARNVGLMLAAAAVVVIVVVIAAASHGDRAGNRLSAAAWEAGRLPSSRPGTPEEGMPERGDTGPVPPPAAGVISVAPSGEAERLADTGAARTGLTIAAGAVVSLTLSGLLLYAGTREPGPECLRFRDGTEAPISTMADGSRIALSGGC